MAGARSSGVLPLIYGIIGAVIASQHHYLAHLGTIKLIASAILAIALWPLILLGVDLHLH